jgi:hypothetical protein
VTEPSHQKQEDARDKRRDHDSFKEQCEERCFGRRKGSLKAVEVGPRVADGSQAGLQAGHETVGNLLQAADQRCHVGRRLVFVHIGPLLPATGYGGGSDCALDWPSRASTSNRSSFSERPLAWPSPSGLKLNLPAQRSTTARLARIEVP